MVQPLLITDNHWKWCSPSKYWLDPLQPYTQCMIMNYPSQSRSPEMWRYVGCLYFQWKYHVVYKYLHFWLPTLLRIVHVMFDIKPTPEEILDWRACLLWSKICGQHKYMERLLLETFVLSVQKVLPFGTKWERVSFPIFVYKCYDIIIFGYITYYFFSKIQSTVFFGQSVAPHMYWIIDNIETYHLISVH